MRIVEGGAQRPLLLSRVPIGPSVTADVVGAALVTDEGDALAGCAHAATLPGASERASGTGAKLIRSEGRVRS